MTAYSTQVNLRVPNHVLARIDAVAKEENLSRTAVLLRPFLLPPEKEYNAESSKLRARQADDVDLGLKNPRVEQVFADPPAEDKDGCSHARAKALHLVRCQECGERVG